MARDWIPHINWLDPPEEREAAQHLSLHISILQHHEDQFRSATELADFLEGALNQLREAGAPGAEKARLANWIRIAGHHGALAVYHFRSALNGIRHWTGQCPTLAQNVNTKAVQAALDRFGNEFPYAIEMRDGIAHFADKMFSPDKIAKNMPDEGGFFHGFIAGRRLTFTANGQYVTLDLTPDTLERLRSIKSDAYEAFRKVSIWYQKGQKEH